VKAQYYNLFPFKDEVDCYSTLESDDTQAGNLFVADGSHLRHPAEGIASLDQASKESVRIGGIETLGQICFQRSKMLFGLFGKDDWILLQPAFSLSRRLVSILR
jgi:hypothetical protein